MNIAEAKEQIRNAVDAYLTKDAFGAYRIPLQRQRPVLLMGAPGIGKTAIMEQVAAELGIGLVAYSMTHHTRQSALGLPFITHKEYGGVGYDASEYTMSEIIASVYDLMAATGVSEGILFLDEINCVSETLAPSMLQFLQYKMFGRHKVPDGWVIVTAGNPPEYNKSVHEFDIVTLDRVKRIDVEPDFDVWRLYAYQIGVHDSIMSFLEIKKDRFYQVERTLAGKQFVTARGWVDLSDMIRLYEEKGFAVDVQLVGQYVQVPDIAEEFALYYELYNRYKSEYGIEGILSGQVAESVTAHAKAAAFDERLSLMSLLLDATGATMRRALEQEAALRVLRDELRAVKPQMLAPDADAAALLLGAQEALEAKLEKGVRAGSIGVGEADALRTAAVCLRGYVTLVNEHAVQGEQAFAVVQEDYAGRVEAMRACVAEAKAQLSHVFSFVENTFGDGQELLVLVTELTARYHPSSFIAAYGCDEYFAHNQDLLVYQRGEDLKERIAALGLEA